MKSEKRLWIYSGLAVPKGVGLVRRVERVRKRVNCVLIVGADTQLIQGLLPPLRRLLDSVKAKLATDLRPHTSATAWSSNSWLVNNLEMFRPSHVLVFLDPRHDPVARQRIDSIISKYLAQSIWLIPAGVFISGAISSPYRSNAAEIAAWVGRIWKFMQ